MFEIRGLDGVQVVICWQSLGMMRHFELREVLTRTPSVCLDEGDTLSTVQPIVFSVCWRGDVSQGGCTLKSASNPWAPFGTKDTVVTQHEDEI